MKIYYNFFASFKNMFQLQYLSKKVKYLISGNHEKDIFDDIKYQILFLKKEVLLINSLDKDFTSKKKLLAQFHRVRTNIDESSLNLLVKNNLNSMLFIVENLFLNISNLEFEG